MLTEIAELIITDGMNALQKSVADSQRAKGLRASGRSADSLHVVRVEQSGRVEYQLRGAYYFTFQQNGRGPNRSGKPSRQMVDDIADWLKIKGLSYSPWAVATNIAKRGIRVPNSHNPGGVLSDAINKDTFSKSVGDRLRAGLGAELRSNLFGIV